MAKKLAKTFAYLGIFFGYDENMNPIHLTLEYFPNSTPDEHITEILRTAPLGKKVTVKLTREGQWANKNFGYLAELPEDVKPLFKNRIHNIPHVTMEVRNGGAPVDTWKAFTGEGSSRPCHLQWTGEITMFYRGAVTSLHQSDNAHLWAFSDLGPGEHMFDRIGPGRFSALK